jgi:hypothetical protein
VPAARYGTEIWFLVLVFMFTEYCELPHLEVEGEEYFNADSVKNSRSSGQSGNWHRSAVLAFESPGSVIPLAGSMTELELLMSNSWKRLREG